MTHLIEHKIKNEPEYIKKYLVDLLKQTPRDERALQCNKSIDADKISAGLKIMKAF